MTIRTQDVPIAGTVEPDAPGGPPERGVDGEPRWRGDGRVVGLFVAITVVLGVVMWFSTTHLERLDSYPAPLSFHGGHFLEGWFRFDGGWYYHIATLGYDDYTGVIAQTTVAYFPAYPLAMRAVGSLLGGDVILAGILISWCTGLAAVVLLSRWLARWLTPGRALVALVAFLIYPYAWFIYGAVYADALFLACTIGAFLLVENDRPVWAGLLAAVATAARPVGFAVVIGLVAVLVERRGVITLAVVERARTRARTSDADADADAGRRVGWDWHRLRFRDAGVLLSAGGAMAWAAYQGVTWGDPLLSAHIQSAAGWDQGQGPGTWFKLHLLEDIGQMPGWFVDVYRHHIDTPMYHPWYYLAHASGAIVQGAFVVIAVLLLPRVARRFGWGYLVYCVGLLAIVILGTKDFQGGGRYLMAAFPVFGAAGDWLADRGRGVQIGLGGASVVLLVWFTSAFARGYYLT
jgi:hypothetical protein